MPFPCHTHLIIPSLLMLIIFGEGHKLWSFSLCRFPSSLILFHPAWAQIVFSTASILFAGTHILSVCALIARDEVSKPSDIYYKPEVVYLHVTVVMIRFSHYCGCFIACEDMYSLSWSHCCWCFFSKWGSNDEISWLGLESTHCAANLVIFPGLSVAREHLSFLSVLCASRAV
jgi:hypothetical protein